MSIAILMILPVCALLLALVALTAVAFLPSPHERNARIVREAQVASSWYVTTASSMRTMVRS